MPASLVSDALWLIIKPLLPVEAANARLRPRIRKRYHAPATPYQRLIADARTGEEARPRVEAIYAALDPVKLLSEIRAGQQRLVEIADRPGTGETAAPTLERFLSGLRTAWQEGEVRPTSRPKEKVKRGRRRPDPFAASTEQVRGWLEAESPFENVSWADSLEQQSAHGDVDHALWTRVVSRVVV